MRIFRVVVAIIVLALAFGSLPGRTTPAIAAPASAPPEIVPNRYIVILNNTYAASVEVFASAVDKRPGTDVDQTYSAAFPGFAGEFTTQAIAALMTDPAVDQVWPDSRVYAQGQSLEPGINRVDADLSWSKSGNGSGTVDIDVAVIDSGIGPNADLNIVNGTNCMGDGYMRDFYGHGTHVAGIIAAKDNDFGVVGMAPGARVWMVRSLDRYGGGTWSQIICGMDWVANHANVIEAANMSLGAGMTEIGSGCNSSPAHRAVCAMTNAGVTVMAAACNAGTDASTCTPGKYPEVISVSAFAEWDGKPGGLGGCRSTPDGFYGCDDRRASFSNYGYTVDIAAPGVGVRSTLFDNQYGYWSGTSMATPHVTGAAALLIAKYGHMSPAEVRSRLLLSAWSGPVPGDFDAFPEPILNVASLGVGSISHFQSQKNGDKITVDVSDLIPATRAIFRLDGEYIGGATVDKSGKAHRTITLADLPYGDHTIKVTNHQKTLSDTFLIRPRINVSPQSVAIGGTVHLDLSGYTAGVSILVSIDTGNGTRNLVRVRADSSGNAAADVTIPPAAGPGRKITAIDDAGVSTAISVGIIPTMTAAGSGEPGEWLALTLRGFRTGDTVNLRWEAANGSILRSKVVTATGSGDVNVKIPADASDGTHTVWATGSYGSKASVTVSISGPASEPTSTPTVTATSTETAPAATDTPATTATNTAAPTATETPTEAPTETATETPTDAPPPAPTDEPTALAEGSPTP
jgi:subtilisin family serine protease